MVRYELSRFIPLLQWRVNQTLCDPGEMNDWSITVIIDLRKSDEAKQSVMQLENLAPVVG